MRLENIEQHSADQQVKSTELTVKYGDAQREISRLNKSIKDLNFKLIEESQKITRLDEQLGLEKSIVLDYKEKVRIF